ncbi:MAG: hypothetical protein IKQ10_04625 [Oscillospiraceae bacterium]|nr:hypothetical protein [Oscillospiraceae bacterium]
MNGFFLPNGVFRLPVRFGPGDSDPFGRTDAAALLRQMQNAAEAHYDALGIGAAAAAAHNSFWALIRTELEIALSPAPGEELRLDTWAGRCGHGLHRRLYRFSDGADHTLVRGLSVWVLMDRTTRQLSADRSWLVDPAPLSFPDEFRGLKRSVMPPPDRCTARTVTREETDVNGHLNNTVYARWAADLLDADYARGHRLRALLAEYKKELPLGAAAELRWRLEADTLTVRGVSDGRDSFLVRCDYDPI